MSQNYAYNYVEVDNVTHMCIGVSSSTNPDMDGYVTSENTTYYAVPVYDENYAFKYYIDGEWYEDAEGTIPWTSSLL